MYRPQKLVAAFLSAAFLCTTGIALADKGGNHGNPHGGAPGQSSSAPGQANAPGGMSGPQSAPGSSMNGSFGSNNAFQGSIDTPASARGDAGGRAGSQADIAITVNGTSRTFLISPPALKALRALAGQKSLIFFTTDGKNVTAVSALGEKMDMRVVSRSGSAFTLQSADGQSRLITLDARTAARLHVSVGATLELTALSAASGRVVALDMVKAHQFDKFSPSGRSTAAARQAQQLARMNAAGKTPPGLPHQCINPAGNTRGFCKGNAGNLRGEDVAANVPGGGGKCGHGASRNGNPAFANQMAKDAANDASGHNPPGLPHECVNPAGNTRGFCKSSSSEGICGGGSAGVGETQLAANLSKPCAPGTSSKSRTNPAFANQMAKDAANDASGHNPPGLPHECVNPAGHTRGFCKSGETASPAMCGSSSAAGSIAAAAVPSGGSAPIAGANGAPRGFQPGIVNGGSGSGGPIAGANGGPRSFQPGVVPVGGAARGAPTHVLGASTGPAGGRRIAALPTRVLPVAIQPVGKRRCVWYKTGVLGASTGPHYIVGTSAIRGKPVLHRKCR